jgi:hypothetical protein
MVGNTSTWGSGNGDVYLIKTSSLGESGCNQVNCAIVTTVVTPTVTVPTLLVHSPSIGSWGTSVSVVSGAATGTRCLVGIDEIENNNVLSIFPNPSTGNITIVFQNELQKGVIEIFNSIGQKVYSEKISSSISRKEINLNAAAGIYFVKVNDGEKVFTKKLIIE